MTTEYDQHIDATIVEYPCPVLHHPFAGALVYEVIFEIENIRIVGCNTDVHVNHVCAVLLLLLLCLFLNLKLINWIEKFRAVLISFFFQKENNLSFILVLLRLSWSPFYNSFTQTKLKAKHKTNQMGGEKKSEMKKTVIKKCFYLKLFSMRDLLEIIIPLEWKMCKSWNG